MPKKILVVDYERDSIEYIQEILKGEDYSLLTASDGQQAIQCYENQVPDLVLTAALLPKLNGFELCKKISSGQLGEVRPVVMYSAIYKAEKYRKEAIFGCGAIDFLEKPVPKWQLMKVIKTAFSEIPVSETKDEGILNFPNVVDESARLSLEVPGEQLPAPWEEDLLDVEALFKDEKAALGLNTSAREFSLNSGAPVPVPSKSSLMAAIETEEIDAALDAFRIDLENEANLREERRVQEIDEELLLKEENILEFEGSQEVSPKEPQSIAEESPSNAFELDEISLGLKDFKDPNPTQDQASSTLGPDQEAIKNEGRSVPSFGSPKPDSFRYWIPLTLLVVVLFFLLIVLR